MRLASRRAVPSSPPPGAAETTSVTRCEGKLDCASAAPCSKVAPAASAAAFSAAERKSSVVAGRADQCTLVPDAPGQLTSDHGWDLAADGERLKPLIAEAHALGVPVLPLSGPSSLILAVAASGLNGQSFAFAGYLPQQPAERAQRIRELESLALKTGQTQMFIETPYRNLALWQSLVQTLQHNTRLAVSSGLMTPASKSLGDSVKNWKPKPPPVDGDTPAVFLIGR